MPPDFLISLLTSFLGSGAALTIAKIWIDLRQERQKRKDEAKFLALQISVLLEGYAIECATQTSEHQLQADSGGAAGRLLSRVPKCPELPKSEAYKLFHADLLDKILSFPQVCEIENEAAVSSSVIVHDEGETILESTIEIGAKALELSENIRKNYSLQPRKISSGDWDIKGFFVSELIRIRNKRELTLEHSPEDSDDLEL